MNISNEEKEEYLKDLFEQLHENGYSRKEAKLLVDKKRVHFDEIDDFRSRLKLMLIIPKRFVTGWDKMKPHEKREALWELGMDTRRFTFKEDVCCYTFGNKRECGEVIISSERTDKEWRYQVVDGKRTASIDSRMFYDQEALQALRNSKS